MASNLVLKTSGVTTEYPGLVLFIILQLTLPYSKEIRMSKEHRSFIWDFLLMFTPTLSNFYIYLRVQSLKISLTITIYRHAL